MVNNLLKVIFIYILENSILQVFFFKVIDKWSTDREDTDH